MARWPTNAAEELLLPREGLQFRASMQCRAHRGSGESFLAEVWFSSYKEGTTPKLAAIMADVTEEEAVPAGSGQDLLDEQERTTLNSRKLDSLRLFGKSEVWTRSQVVRVTLERYRDLL